MNRQQSRYFATARLMDEALLDLLQSKNAEFITVKEVCAKAGVGRSTFYLHYQGIPDLIDECLEYVNARLFERLEHSSADTIERIRTAPLDELVFVTDEYLVPYLEFVRDNRFIYRATLVNSHTLRAQERLEALARHIIDPVLERFGYPSGQRPFVVSFYVHGLSAVVNEWIKDNCEVPVEEMARIIRACVRSDNASGHPDSGERGSREPAAQ